MFKDKPVDEVKIEKVVEPGLWKVFAMIGMIFGIVSISFAGISILGSLLLMIKALL